MSHRLIKLTHLNYFLCFNHRPFSQTQPSFSLTPTKLNRNKGIPNQKIPEIICGQRKNLLEKLEELKAELEPTRLEQEITILAQKADVDEELDRMDSHLKEVERIIESNGQKGRRLDFLMQELNREANTLSSKSIVVGTTLGAVELKVLIEQMREQIQNVE